MDTRKLKITYPACLCGLHYIWVLGTPVTSVLSASTFASMISIFKPETCWNTTYIVVLLCSKTECHLLRMKDEVFTMTCRALSNLTPPPPRPRPPPPSLQSPPLREHWSLGTSLNFISISCIWNVLSPKKNYVTCFLLSFSFSPFFQSLFSLSWTWYHLFLLQFFFFLPLATN